MPCTQRYAVFFPGGMTPPVTPPSMAGAPPPHCPPAGGRRRKRGAPRAVVLVRALWLGSLGRPQTGRPRRRLGLRLGAQPQAGRLRFRLLLLWSFAHSTRQNSSARAGLIGS